MIYEEFEKLTGFHPSKRMYDAIEAEYMACDDDKEVFCDNYKNNTDGLASKIAHDVDVCDDNADENIKFMRDKMEYLERRLEEEEEWVDSGLDSNISDSAYSYISQNGAISYSDAKKLVAEEFGFDTSRIFIKEEVRVYSTNRHGDRRVSGTTFRPPAFLNKTTYYVRFSSDSGHDYEAANGVLYTL